MQPVTANRMAAWLVAAIAAYYLLQALLPVLVCGLIGWGVWKWVNRSPKA